MLNNMIPLFINNEQFEINVSDYGFHWKLRVYKNSKLMGFKDLPIKTDVGQRVLEWTVKQIMLRKETL